LSTSETVDVETPMLLATSIIVERLNAKAILPSAIVEFEANCLILI
jgi:hypothetical protein